MNTVGTGLAPVRGEEKLWNHLLLILAWSFH